MRYPARGMSTTSDPDKDTELQKGVPDSARSLTPTFVLTVIEGSDRGASLRIDGAQPSRVLVGQSPACHLRLTDPTVSRRHAAFDATESGLRFTDLGSTNGSHVGGLVILDAFLAGGESLRLGNTVLRVDRSDDAQRVTLSTATRFGRLVGASVEMRRLYPLCERVAASSVPVIIEGETGTGKEVLAESLHEAGSRASAPFVIFDCTAVAPSIIESELFGHERGAFTGAVSARKGLFEQAHGGTLFIDEIGDLEMSLQPKLLRAVERSEVRRMGGDRWIPTDVRIVTATRRDLDAEVQAGRFRDDLFFRLAVVRIELPPLRTRRGDVATLAQHFWTELGGVGSVPRELMSHYEQYGWPGNVRELHNVVARRLALGEMESTGAATSRAASGEGAGDFIARVIALDVPLPRARQQVVDELERRYVERMVALHGGNVAHAAAASGLGHRYFQKIRARLAKT